MVAYDFLDMKLSTFLVMTMTIVTIAAFIYRKLFCGLYQVKMDCTQLGFENAGRDGFKGSRKREMINELRKRKRNDQSLPQIFPNGWFAILEADELLPKQSREINVLGLNLVAWRGESGAVHVADAYCLHLGAHLGVSSRVMGDCIECPFHSWCFDGEEDGKLVNVPYSKKVPSAINLKMWDTHEAEGTIYLWHHVDKKPPTWYPQEVCEIKEKKWNCRSVIHIQMGCLAQDITENGADLTHFNELHTDFSWLSGDMKNLRWLRPICRHMHDGKWEADPDVKHIAHVTASQWLQFFGGQFSLMHTQFDSIYYGPGILHVTITTPSAIFKIIQTHTPRDFMSLDYTARIYTSPWVPAPMLRSVTDVVANQVTRDVRVLNRKAYLKQPMLLQEDSGIKKFRRWHAQFHSS